MEPELDETTRIPMGDFRFLQRTDVDEVKQKLLLEKLSSLRRHIYSTYSESQVHAVVKMTNEGHPFLNVESCESDVYLRDRGCLHMNCYFDEQLQIHCLLLTANREPMHHFAILDEPSYQTDDLFRLIELLTNKQFHACTGFTSINDESFPAGLFVEKYDGSIIYRAPTCAYVVADINEKLCTECSFALQRFTKTPRRTRGRPKGSTKVKIQKSSSDETATTDCGYDHQFQNSDEIKPNSDSFDSSVFCTIVNENNPDHVTFGDDEEIDDMSDAIRETQTYRGFRKRITTKRQRALLLLGTKKRGRPPIRIASIKCTECDQSFELLRDYKRHRMEHKRSFKCTFELCRKRFMNQRDLDVHLRKHRGEKPFECTDCKNAYLTKQDLRLHYRSHTGERPFKCHVCGKCFTRITQLKVHKVVHTKERLHLCQHCGASFGSVSSLIDHRKRKHESIRKHACSICPKVFVTRQELQAHTRIHTGEKPYRCSHCNKCFSRMHHVKRHIEFVHGIKKPRLLYSKHEGDGEISYGNPIEERPPPDILSSFNDACFNDDDRVFSLAGTPAVTTINIATSNSSMENRLVNDDLVQTEFIIDPESGNDLCLVVKSLKYGEEEEETTVEQVRTVNNVLSDDNVPQIFLFEDNEHHGNGKLIELNVNSINE